MGSTSQSTVPVVDEGQQIDERIRLEDNGFPKHKDLLVLVIDVRHPSKSRVCFIHPEARISGTCFDCER